MFKTRLLSGIVLVILAIALILAGGDVLLFATLAISCIGMYELYRVFGVEKSVLGGIGYLAAIVYYCNLKWDFIPEILRSASAISRSRHFLHTPAITLPFRVAFCYLTRRSSTTEFFGIVTEMPLSVLSYAVNSASTTVSGASKVLCACISSWVTMRASSTR